jgi:hypothetical protein
MTLKVVLLGGAMITEVLTEKSVVPGIYLSTAGVVAIGLAELASMATRS